MEDSVSVLRFAECRAREIFSVMKDVLRKEPKLASQNLPHNMRRRAASHNPKRLPRNLRNAVAKQEKSKHKKRKHCHKNRQTEYIHRQLNSTWLPTHIWFAKRFHMKKMYGYKLPLHSTGKHFRVSFKAATRKTLLQDMSYYCCIELNGTQENLLLKLSSLTDDSLGTNFASELCIDGSKEGQCFLYHPYSYPFQAIGLVSFLWKPVSNIEFTSVPKSERPSPSSTVRQLWIWCHPSIHFEVVEVLTEIFRLKESCGKIEDSPTEKESEDVSKNKKSEHKFASKVNHSKTKLHFKKERVFASEDVTMMLLKDTLVRHRLIGPLALSAITKVLKSADVSMLDGESFSVPADEDAVSASSESQLSRCAETIRSPVDAKLWWQKYYECEETRNVHDRKSKLLENLGDVNFSYLLPLSMVVGLTVKDPRLDWSSKKGEDENYFHGNNEELATLREFPPYYSSSALWDKEIRDEVTETQMPENEINKERSKYVCPKEGLNLGLRENKVPVLLVHQSGFNGVGSGWDLIAPQGWGMAFWIPFSYSGPHAAGIRDVCNVNVEAGLPNFPYSYPDTSAGRLHEEEDREENTKKFLRYPPNKRPNFETLGVASPFSMPWVTLLDNWEDELRQQNSEWIETVFSSSNKASSSQRLSDKDGNGMFVLRSKKLLWELRRLNENISKAVRRLDVEEVQSMLGSLTSFANLCVTEVEYVKRSVILVKIDSLCRGIPKKFSAIYLPNESDHQLLRENSKHLNPVEPNHLEPAGKRQKLCKKEKKEKLEHMLSSWKKPENLFLNSERKVIGYVSEGGFSSLRGFGCGIGHCALTGFLNLFEHCIKFQIPPVILFREQNSFQYRAANVEVIDFY